jgi:hypothetical protein
VALWRDADELTELVGRLPSDLVTPLMVSWPSTMGLPPVVVDWISE